MRPLIGIATFVLLLGLTPVFAQHGGGHASAGGHGGMAAHGGFSGGHSFTGHAFGGAHSGAGFANRSFAHRSFANRSSFRRRGFNRDGVRIRTFGFRNNCFGGFCRGRGFPWWDAGAFDPYWWWDSGSSYDQDEQQQIGLANEMNAQSLEEQRMREQGTQDPYVRSAPPPTHAADTDPTPATVLVFRDQRRQEVQNYAIVGQTLWSFASQRTQKIPLSDLDLPATTQANDERGVDFRVPAGHEGQ